MDSLGAEKVMDYGRVKGAILQTLYLNLEVYQRQLRTVAFGPDYHPRLTAQKIWQAGLRWLCLVVQTAVQVVEAVLVEHYIAILPFKLKNWVMYHLPAMLDEANGSMCIHGSGSLPYSKSMKVHVTKSEMLFMFLY